MPDRAIDSQQLASFPATASITLEAEIEQSRAQEHRMGWMNYWAAYAVAILALTGSIAATVLVVIEANKWITATFAAMPVAVVAMTKMKAPHQLPSARNYGRSMPRRSRTGRRCRPSTWGRTRKPRQIAKRRVKPNSSAV
jgi:hypothetical protein